MSAGTILSDVAIHQIGTPTTGDAHMGAYCPKCRRSWRPRSIPLSDIRKYCRRTDDKECVEAQRFRLRVACKIALSAMRGEMPTWVAVEHIEAVMDETADRPGCNELAVHETPSREPQPGLSRTGEPQRERATT